MLYPIAFYLHPPIQSFLPADPSRLLSGKSVLGVSISALERSYFPIHKVSKIARIFWIYYGIIIIGKAPLELGFEEKVRLLTVHANHPSPKRFLGILLDLGGAFLNSESYEFMFFKGTTSHSRKGRLDTSLASVTRETGSDESMTQSKPLEHNQTFVEMEEAQSFPWHLTLGGQTGQQLSVTISLPRGGWQ